MLLSIVVLEGAGRSLQVSLGAKISNKPTSNAIVYALSIGIIIPIFSSIYPIKEALQQTLSIALDPNRSKS